MNTFPNISKLPARVQKDLVEYNIMRSEAKKLNGEGNLFGIKETADDYQLYSKDNILKLPHVNGDVSLAAVAPDFESFDMLAPADFSKKLKLAEPNSLRAFLMKLVDTCEI